MGTREERCALDGMNVDTAGIGAQVALVLSYDGAPFAGFARQPGQHTVQGELERALSTALRRPVEVVCAGRTDAGVHARGQVVSFPLSPQEVETRNLLKLKRSAQALTDDAIAIQTAALMPPGFSARFSAVEREYRYLVVPGGRHPLFLRQWSWDVRRELDVDAMNRAAALLVGEHDFKSFCLAASAKDRNTVRALREVRVVPVNVLGEDALSIRVVGTAFLHSMVRAIVGTLVMVGSGLREPAWVGQVLQARDRRAAGENAPAKGLVFWQVRYRGGLPCYGRDAVAPGDGGFAPAPDGAGNRPGAVDGRAPRSSSPRLAEMPAGRFQSPRNCAGEPPVDDASREDRSAAHSEGPAEKPAEGAGPGPQAGDDADAEGPTAEDIAAAEALEWELERREDAVRLHGRMQVNEGAGPAVAAAPRTRKVAPADPQPAEGEVSISFELHRDSAATRAAKAQNERRRSQGGLWRRLFGKTGGGDA